MVLGQPDQGAGLAHVGIRGGEGHAIGHHSVGQGGLFLLQIGACQPVAQPGVVGCQWQGRLQQLHGLHGLVLGQGGFGLCLQQIGAQAGRLGRRGRGELGQQLLGITAAVLLQVHAYQGAYRRHMVGVGLPQRQPGLFGLLGLAAGLQGVGLEAQGLGVGGLKRQGLLGHLRGGGGVTGIQCLIAAGQQRPEAGGVAQPAPLGHGFDGQGLGKEFGGLGMLALPHGDDAQPAQCFGIARRQLQGAAVRGVGCRQILAVQRAVGRAQCLLGGGRRRRRGRCGVGFCPDCTTWAGRGNRATGAAAKGGVGLGQVLLHGRVLRVALQIGLGCGGSGVPGQFVDGPAPQAANGLFVGAGLVRQAGHFIEQGRRGRAVPQLALQGQDAVAHIAGLGVLLLQCAVQCGVVFRCDAADDLVVLQRHRARGRRAVREQRARQRGGLLQAARLGHQPHGGQLLAVRPHQA